MALRVGRRPHSERRLNKALAAVFLANPATDSQATPRPFRQRCDRAYTHTFAQDERVAAEKIGELLDTGWPEKEKGKLISFPHVRMACQVESASRFESMSLVAGGGFVPQRAAHFT